MGTHCIVHCKTQYKGRTFQASCYCTCLCAWLYWCSGHTEYLWHIIGSSPCVAYNAPCRVNHHHVDITIFGQWLPFNPTFAVVPTKALLSATVRFCASSDRSQPGLANGLFTLPPLQPYSNWASTGEAKITKYQSHHSKIAKRNNSYFYNN